ncbi:MAG: hypothetical protein KGH69_03990 [Candidatus Micrarchaeota archaeon]|nr:hypothetical protein [Candidatus Micrarchaeota archaeon]
MVEAVVQLRRPTKEYNGSRDPYLQLNLRLANQTKDLFTANKYRREVIRRADELGYKPPKKMLEHFAKCFYWEGYLREQRHALLQAADAYDIASNLASRIGKAELIRKYDANAKRLSRIRDEILLKEIRRGRGDTTQAAGEYLDAA